MVLLSFRQSLYPAVMIWSLHPVMYPWVRSFPSRPDGVFNASREADAGICSLLVSVTANVSWSSIEATVADVATVSVSWCTSYLKASSTVFTTVLRRTYPLPDGRHVKSWAASGLANRTPPLGTTWAPATLAEAISRGPSKLAS